MSHRALGPQFPVGKSSSSMMSARDDLDRDFGTHWEDHETPDCHYCGEVAHTTGEHEVREGWATSPEQSLYVSQPRKIG